MSGRFALCEREAIFLGVAAHEIDDRADALSALRRFAESTIDLGDGAGALRGSLLNLLFRETVTKAHIHGEEAYPLRLRLIRKTLGLAGRKENNSLSLRDISFRHRPIGPVSLFIIILIFLTQPHDGLSNPYRELKSF